MGSLSSCSWVCGSPTLPGKDTLRGRARHSSFQKSDDGVCRGREGMSRAGTVSRARLALPGAGSSAKARAALRRGTVPRRRRRNRPDLLERSPGLRLPAWPRNGRSGPGPKLRSSAEAGEALQ